MIMYVNAKDGLLVTGKERVDGREISVFYHGLYICVRVMIYISSILFTLATPRFCLIFDVAKP